MANADIVTFNIAAFVATLFLLEIGADKFLDHTAAIAHRTGIPETIIGLVTAGGEWEELAVVVASLARHRSSLAIGNIIGSAISNILGAFSLGLLFHGSDAPIEFARSSRIYSLILLVLTTFVVPLTCFPERIVWLVSGYLLVAFFAIYIGCVGWAITRGALTAPEDSEDSSDDESSREDDEGQNERCISGLHSVTTPLRADETTPFLTELPGFEDDPDNRRAAPIIATTRIQSNTRHGRCHTLHHHVGYLLFGFLAIFLAGYVLAHAATTIADEFEISDVLFGVVILSIATTLPEKFVAIMSGQRGHAGILVANTAGSNVFLLALCLGIVMLDTSGEFQRGNVNMAELGVLWVSTVAFTSTVCFGGKFSRWIGVAMLTAYVVFIILEFTILHGVAMDD